MSGLPHTPYASVLGQAPKMNVKQNIIAGPEPGQYWNHSPGLERPLLREEGPFPIQGNIGGLLTQGGSKNYSACGGGPPVSGSPNCTTLGTFRSDMYTTKDSCGEECVLSYPESFGGKSFGLTGDKTTTAHALHAYKNERAVTEGSGPSSAYGCSEWVPRLGVTQGNSCTLDQVPAFQQVGYWPKLPEAKGIVNYTFNQ